MSPTTLTFLVLFVHVPHGGATVVDLIERLVRELRAVALVITCPGNERLDLLHLFR